MYREAKHNYKCKYINIGVLLFCTFLFISFSGCDKQHAKKLAGNYNCKVHYHSWTETPSSFDTSYFKTLTVSRSGKYLYVLHHEIHVDLVWDGKEYFEDHGRSTFRVRFDTEAIYIKVQGFGLGGGSATTYEGIKE